MWSPDRRSFLALGGAGLAAGLSGCGFRPALRDGGPARIVRQATRLTLPQGRLGFALREVLARRLGRPSGEAPYELTADLVLEESGLVITPDSAITRFVVRGVSRWALAGPDGFAPVAGESESMSAYSATGSLFATRAARRDAEARVVRDLGERIVTEIYAELDRRGEEAA